ncbi:PREDICTED: E3 ubiquitin/ISG15 ligase TRIM25-like [Nanorana parkeri]|uniref:E3 ubiquitin/ISG15 ligase TRIM25-like n=1 Tax=Nanorana parkeri TaxID=125878 RepID=UPI00085496D3|nr:PREDICTED: E3 ubiquitin/ISG15 ligase TRIM25-like [Nanorana parkeri]
MASADLGAELECSVCLKISTDPVTPKCGHNVCQDCIGGVLDTQEGSGGYSCPECNQRFEKHPAHQENLKVPNIVAPKPDQEESGVLCTQCYHAPVPAVKSCLMCEASLCDNHLRVHSKAPEHVLCDPTTSLENRKCSVHKKILEYYCTEDSACICVSCCLIGGHKGHQVESLDEASEKKKKKLRNVLQKLMTEREETEKIVQSLEAHRRKVEGEAAGETERVIALFRDLRRRLEDLEKRVLSVISRREEQALLSDLILQLEVKKDEVSRKMRHIEELCNMTDPLTVLQESDTGDLCDTEDGDDEDRERHDELLHDGGDLDVAGISHTLHTGISDIMSGVIVQEGPDILLDENTASNYLQISDDRKSASKSDINQNRPETPERFQYYPQVLSSRSFSSEQHHWEVDVGGSDSWIVGMCYPSIERRGGQSEIGDNKKSWGLQRRWGCNQYSVTHDRKEIRVPGNISINIVRIELDYEAGRISFYELCDPIRLLHTFTTTFTEPLYAGLLASKPSSSSSSSEPLTRNKHAGIQASLAARLFQCSHNVLLIVLS